MLGMSQAELTALIGLGVAIILFEGGMDLKLGEWRRVGHGIGRMRSRAKNHAAAQALSMSYLHNGANQGKEMHWNTFERLTGPHDGITHNHEPATHRVIRAMIDVRKVFGGGNK